MTIKINNHIINVNHIVTMSRVSDNPDCVYFNIHYVNKDYNEFSWYFKHYQKIDKKELRSKVEKLREKIRDLMSESKVDLEITNK